MSSERDAATMSPRDRTEGLLVGLGIFVLALALIPVHRRWGHNFPLAGLDRYFWATMVVVFLGTTAAAEVLWRLVLRRSCGYAPVLGLAIAIAAAISFYPIANGALDRNVAVQRVYVIAGRYCRAAWRQGGPEVLLQPAATPNTGGFRLPVPRRFCREARDGQEMLLDLKPGFFGSAWVARYELRP